MNIPWPRERLARAQSSTAAPPTAVDEPELDVLVERERMRQHVRGNTVSALSGFLPLTYMGLVLKGLVPGGPLLTWCIALAVVDTIVAIHAVSYFLHERTPQTWPMWRMRLTAFQALKGLLWGVPALWVPLSPDVKMYVFAILSAVQSIGMICVMQYHAPTIAFSTCTWMVTAVLMLSGATGFDGKLALGIPVLLASMNLYLWESCNQFVRGLRARFYADALSAQLAQQAAKNHELATRDDLTGLFNRREGMAQLGRLHERRRVDASSSQNDFSVLVLDIDHFKQINDRHGHPVGDEVLQAVGERIQSVLRDHDTVARIGGEEFIVLLTRSGDGDRCVNETTTLAAAERIRLAINDEPVPSAAGLLTVTVSIGATTSHHAATATELFTLADQALYRAKADGRNRTQLHATGIIAQPAT